MTKKDSTAKKPTKADYELRIEELTQDVQRIQAEFINFKRRSEEDKLRAMATGKEMVVMSLLPILDNLDRALEHEPQDIIDNKWVQGVTTTAKQLEAQLAEIGIHKFGKIGDVFNPLLHDAVSMDDGDGDIEVIIGVAQVGYIVDDRVIRHAMVQVGKRKL